MELEDVFRAHQQAVFAYFFRVMGNRQDAVSTGNPLIVTAAAIILPWSLIRFLVPDLVYEVVPFVPSVGFLV